jgi:Right handed beta helix region
MIKTVRPVGDALTGAGKSKLQVAVATAVTALILGLIPGLGLAPASAEETPISCGQVVTGSIKVANDLTCVESTALIATSDTVIDLNGHHIKCIGIGYQGSCQGILNGVNTPDPEPEDGVLIQGQNNVHVLTTKPGGTIEGFDNGIHMERVTNIKVEHLVITGPPSPGVVNPRPFSHGILIRQSSCSETNPEMGNIHIGTGESSGNDLSNANQGIAINGNCVHVVHNRVHDNNSNTSVPSNGILINGGSENVVRGNEVFKNGDPADDTEQDGGITMRNRASRNHITNNVVNDNVGDGISVRSFSFDNKMDNNTMLRNGAELSGTVFYDAAGRLAPGEPTGSLLLANTWNQNNVCVTQNQEVPPGVCGTLEGN